MLWMQASDGLGGLGGSSEETLRGAVIDEYCDIIF
ncbi:hypothetical protein BH11PSE12_BH11PSE12_28420 [soil metagenome]